MKTTYLTSAAIALSLTIIPLTLHAAQTISNLPQIKVKREFIVQGNEDFEARRGFGELEGETRMMNLMMVEGSGMEGMDMSGGMKMSPVTPPSNSTYQLETKLFPKEPRVGVHEIELVFRDLKSHQPMTGLQLQSQVAMTRMDMGTETPPIKEIEPGVYHLHVKFSMRGPWSVKVTGVGIDESLVFEVKSTP